ncbi:MAG TPA: hypothetical protein VH253_05495 [Phycisphaerae bacterium]|nr:hypothetical protein [Phycisphaerae bacterium]
MRRLSFVVVLCGSTLGLPAGFAQEGRAAASRPLVLLGGRLDDEVRLIRSLYGQRPGSLEEVDGLKARLLTKYANASPDDVGKICAELCMAMDNVSIHDQPAAMADKQGLAFMCLRDHMPSTDIALQLAVYLRVDSPVDSANPGQCVKLWLSLWQNLESEIDPTFDQEPPVIDSAGAEVIAQRNLQWEVRRQKLIYSGPYSRFLAAYIEQQKFDKKSAQAFLDGATVDERLRQQILEMSRVKELDG